MAAPFVFRPIEPVLHDIVDRDAGVPILLHHIQQFGLRVVTLARLPEAEGPFWHHRSVARQPPIARDRIVHGRCRNDIVIDRPPRFAGEAYRMAVWRWQGIGMLQRDIALVRLPIDFKLHRLPGCQLELEIVIPGVPVLAPAIEHFLAICSHSDIAGGIEPELVSAADLGRKRAGPDDPLRLHRISGRILPRCRRFDCSGRFHRPARLIPDVLIIDARLRAGHDKFVAEIIVGLPAALSPLVAAVGHHHRREGQVLVRLRIAHAGDRVIIPQQPIPACRNEIGNADCHVVLGKLNILAIVVHLAVLVLAKTVKPFVRPAIELRARGEPLLPLKLDRRYPPRRGVFVEQQFSLAAIDDQPPVGQLHHRCPSGRRQAGPAV